ncbi:MAG: class I adenylate-forming enzyme family protein, partial [Pseudomonadota bacterium]
MADITEVPRDWVQLLLSRQDRQPALTLVLEGSEVLRWSYAELQVQRRYCERVLLDCGVQPGDRVLVSCNNNPHFFAILLAALSLELCLLPLHTDFAEDQVEQLLLAQQPRLVIVDGAAGVLRLQHPCVVRLHERPELWLQPVLTTHSRRRSRLLLANAAAETPRVEAALLFHSSGSTGKPKGMRYGKTALNHFLDKLQGLYGALPDLPVGQPLSDRVNVLPVTHWGGLSFCLQALLEGRTLHLLRSAHPADHLQLLQRTRCQLLLLVPALLHELLAADAAALPALRHCLAMGEAISLAQLQQLSTQLGLRVYNAYGMSECLTGIFNCHDDAAMPLGSCGRQRFGDVKLIDADGNAHDSDGELCVRNATTTPLYTEAALNREKYHGGWYHTGDRFRRDGNGYYFFVGRVDDMCVINGRNIFRREVEQVLLRHPAVAACVVTALTCADGRQRLATAVQLQTGVSMGAAELLDFYLQHGAVFATPAWV